MRNKDKKPKLKLAQKSAIERVSRSLKLRARPLPRYPGRTYVMMREGDPWHACHVTILAHTRAFKINGIEYFDCYLPKRWRKIAAAKQEETRPVRRSELW